MAAIDDDIDRLYQIGLGAFVAERNALAKRTKRADMKALEKPAAPAWAVNQLYWHERDTFERLVAASEAVRGAHRALLAGATADVRAAETAHREALRAALASAKRFLTDGGLAASPATLDAVSRTLEALPHPAANGRLTAPLTPLGLDALSGLTLAPLPPRALRVVPHPTRPREEVADQSDEPTTMAEAGLAARRRAALAERRRSAEAEVTEAQTALAAAEDRLAEAEREVVGRRRDRDAARDRVAAALLAVRAVGDIE
jgi:hypothetical protein